MVNKTKSVFIFLLVLLIAVLSASGWLGSTTYRRDIVNETSTSIALAVNSTGGFGGNTIWTNPGFGDLFLYYNTTAEYIVGNDSNETVPFETEGGGLNNSISSVYDQLHLFHFYNQTKNMINSSNDLIGSNVLTSDNGVFSKANYYDGTAYSYSDNVNITTQNFSVEFWFKVNSTGSAQQHIVDKWDVTDRSFIIRLENDILKFYIRNTGDSTTATLGTTSGILNQTWYHAVALYNQSSQNISIYIDGKHNASGIVGSDRNLGNNARFTIGANYHENFTADLQGTVDELRIYDKVISPVRIEETYNNSQNLNMLFGAEERSDADTLDITNTTPENNHTFNTSTLEINATVDSTFDFNCSLYINSTLNQSRNNINNGSDVNVPFNVTFANGNYDYYFFCTNNETNETSSTKDFIIDTITPDITFNNPANDNSTTLNLVNDENLTADIDITDTNLYSYYYNITYSNGSLIANFSNTSLTGLSSYTITDSLNMSGYRGTFNAVVKVCDGHTDNKIDMDAEKDYFSKKLTFDRQVIIQPKNRYDFNAADYQRKTDRYSFEFQSKSFKSQESFIVEGKKYVDILHRKSRYEGHLVIDGRYWVDFENPNVRNIIVKRINKRKVEVNVIMFKPISLWSFNSIGELNCRTLTRQFRVIRPYLDVNITGYKNITGSLWIRNVSYSLNYSCANASNLLFYANSTLIQAYSTTCDNSSHIITDSYQYPVEASFNVSFVLNETNNVSYSGFFNQTFENDLYDPDVYISINVTPGFNITVANASLRCIDNRYNDLNYTLVLNNITLFQGNLSNNTLQVNNTANITDGENNISGTCADLFGQAQDNLTQVLYNKVFVLIDEKLNQAFDVNNITSTRIYFDDNQTFHDFQASGNSNISFLSDQQEKLRIRLEYSTGEIINRYIDPTLSETSNIRVCANTEGTTHYEQIIISASEKPVRLVSQFSNCLVAQDYTRFAYQDSKILRAYTIPTSYFLYTFSNGVSTYLASLDGADATFYNLDILEFNAEGYNIGTSRKVVSFERLGNQSVRIYFKNLNNDSVQTNITISQVNNSYQWFNVIETTTPNEFYVVFDYSTLSIGNNTLLRLEIETADSTGETDSLVKYFTLQGSSGIISAGVAVAVAILLTLFGMTFLTTSGSMGWFGAFTQLGSIAILSLAVSTWYITFLMSVNAIIFVFLIIISFTSSSSRASLT